MTGPPGSLGQTDIYSDTARLRTLLAMPRVRVYSKANIPIGNAVWTTLTFDSEQWDVDGMHSTIANTDRLTCAVPGLYAIVGQATFLANGTGYRGARIRLNNAATIAQCFQINNGASIDVPLSPLTQYQLSAGDYVTLQVYQDRGGILNVMYYAQYSPEFMMARIG